MLPSSSAFDAVLYNQGLRLGDTRDAYTVLFDRGLVERDLDHNETSTGRKIQVGDQTEIFRSVPQASYRAMTTSPAEAIAMATQVRVEDGFPYKMRRRKHLEPYTIQDIKMTWNVVSSMIVNREGFFTRMESIIRL